MSTLAESRAIARRYASAAFDLAREAEAVPQIAQDMKDLFGYIKESHELRHLLFDRSIDRNIQKKALDEVLTKAKFHKISINFTHVLLDNGRIMDLKEIIRVFEKIRFQTGEKIVAHVRSAVPLSKAQHETLQKTLTTQISGDVRLDVSVDPNLIAGVVIEVGNTLIDSTLKTKIDRLALSMKGA